MHSAGLEPTTDCFVGNCSTTELNTRPHFDVRAPVASSSFGRQNTTRRVFFTCRLLNRNPGRWLLARTPNLCADALARNARTILHYPLPLAPNDVGVAGCTTTCSLTDLHSRPRPVHEPRYFRASPCRYPRPRPRTTGGWTCLDRPHSRARRDTMGYAPFPPLPTVSSARPLYRTSTEADDPEFGGGPRIQTAHLPLARRMLYQLS